MYSDRIRLIDLHNKVMPASQAAVLIQNGITVGMSNFARADDERHWRLWRFCL